MKEARVNKILFGAISDGEEERERNYKFYELLANGRLRMCVGKMDFKLSYMLISNEI